MCILFKACPDTPSTHFEGKKALNNKYKGVKNNTYVSLLLRRRDKNEKKNCTEQFPVL